MPEVAGSARPVVFLMGPTAVGKTDVAVELVDRLPVSIVSVDSAMVYRGMDIGTGKPGAETQARAPHALVDIGDPETPYSAAEFHRDAVIAIDEIHACGRIPLLVGGTGLYFRALRNGLSPLPSANPQVRQRLAREAAREGWPALHERLAVLDPEAAARIRPSDSQRIQRALEVHALTGTPLSELQQRQRGNACPYPVLALSLEPADRAWLHERIERRFQAMLDQGLVAEVDTLRARAGVHADLPSTRSVGYRQVISHLEGRLSSEEMRERAVIATRQLARRQLTWLRGERVAERIEAESRGLVSRVASLVGPVLQDSRWHFPGG